jgi:hypothetical protein
MAQPAAHLVDRVIPPVPGREGLLDLTRPCLETQARLWPDLSGTAAVPATVGKDVFRKTRQVTDRQTGTKKVIHLPAAGRI